MILVFKRAPGFGQKNPKYSRLVAQVLWWEAPVVQYCDNEIFGVAPTMDSKKEWIPSTNISGGTTPVHTVVVVRVATTKVSRQDAMPSRPGSVGLLTGTPAQEKNVCLSPREGIPIHIR